MRDSDSESGKANFIGKDRPAAMRRAGITLRVAVLLFALGQARAIFTRVGTSLGSVALFEWEVAHEHILIGERIFAVILLVCAASLLIRITVVASIVIAGLVCVESFAAVKAGGTPFYQYTPLANSLRYLTPLALLPLVRVPGSLQMQDKRRRISAWILRSGLAVVFITHGVEAWQLHPHFIDYIIGSGETLGGTAISESTASALLKGIAVLDAIAAVMVVARISPLVIGWLCFWGLVTALARPMSLGIHSYPEVLLRAPHFLAPLALAWLVTFKSRRQISGAGVRKSESAPDPAAIRDDRPPHAP